MGLMSEGSRRHMAGRTPIWPIGNRLTPGKTHAGHNGEAAAEKSSLRVPPPPQTQTQTQTQTQAVTTAPGFARLHKLVGRPPGR
jgi:hypothetical protein